MVLGPELEDDVVAVLSSDCLWVEQERSVFKANGNADIGCKCSAGEGGSDESGEMHYDWLKCLRNKETSSFGSTEKY